MKINNKYEVQIYYTGFCVYEVFAENEEEAILKARNLKINPKELLISSENWNLADTAIKIEDEKSKI